MQGCAIPNNDHKLPQKVSAYMHEQFSFKAFPSPVTMEPALPLEFPVDLSIAMNQMVATLLAAYQNPSQLFPFYLTPHSCSCQFNQALT